MKLLHVITSMDPKMGGVCQAVRSIAVGLSQLDVINEVLSLDAPDASFLSTDPLKIHALGPARGPWAYSAAITPWLLEKVTTYDVVIVHGLWQFHSFAVGKALQLLRRDIAAKAFIPKMFVMPHGMLDPYFQRAAGRKIKAIRNWAYWKVIEADVVNRADGLLFTCDEERNLAREPFRPYHPAHELVVGLGVEEPPKYRDQLVQQFRAHCLGGSNDKFILFLSRIHEKKGVDLLLNSSKNTKHSKHNLVVAGPGLETTYGISMKKIVDESNAPVTFVGMLSGDIKWGAFYGCEAFILPSHQENFGIAVVEALACCKPVLISNQVNIWREVKDGGGGLVANDTLEGADELLSLWTSATADEKRIWPRGHG